MKKEKIYHLDEPDILFVYCKLKQRENAPISTIITKEPNKTMRIVPVYTGDKFDKFVYDFVEKYNFNPEDLFFRFTNAVLIDDDQTVYTIVSKDQAVSFSVDLDALTGFSLITRGEFFEWAEPLNDGLAH